ncbi:phytanoyl-CoA dioxygenase family protein [Alkalicoccus chagannorensis]|uniref:phytanoyl-CoA dioxygenase family protein n=1 Tax=Alkalicoccus chagannorensis TaxID=427072 RepID=UPI0003F615B1|nr:phytanoyl-CoA dioxygenase family protein [Alkalicoccus chagannorensis]
MKLQMGNAYLEMGSKYLTTLRDSNDILGDFNRLSERLAEDGYLLIRQFHNKENIQLARQALVDRLNNQGKINTDYPLIDAIAKEDVKGSFFGGVPSDENQDLAPFYELVTNEEVMDFFSHLLGEEALTLDYKWPRAVPPGGNTGAHYDIVYMGRGTKDLYTMWTPLGNVTYEQGPLAMLLGSQHFEKVKNSYGKMDVDRDHVETGWFSNDPIELVDHFNGQWATTEFEAGDVIIFGMFMMHSSFNNDSDSFRMSADTRYQAASEATDERWVGKNPKGHYAWGKEKDLITVEEARKTWGL